MNVVYTLQYMGYDNGVDFEHRASTGLVWLSDSVPEPSDQELKDAWDAAMAEEEPKYLEEDRVFALEKADALSGGKRMEYISAGAGQDLIYQEKAQQAQDYANSGYTLPLTDFPYLDKEATALGVSGEDIAEIILAKRDEWIEVSSNIEELKLSMKRDIKAATDRDEIKELIVTFRGQLASL